MNLFKKLFGKRKPEEGSEEPYIPIPAQQVPGLEPIIVQAIESLYASGDDQKLAFEYSIR